MRCYVCQRETPPRHRYCDRCRLFFRAQTDKKKRRLALQEAYDKEADGFRCRYSGVLLEERDTDDPFHLCFDHFLPVRTSRLVVSSELFNHMKFELTEDEFYIAIQELIAHRAGRPFDRDCIAFSHWGVRAPALPGRGLRREERTAAASTECVVCSRPSFRHSVYCPRCRRFVFWGGKRHTLRAKALREAWCQERDGFLCHGREARGREAGERVVPQLRPSRPWGRGGVALWEVLNMHIIMTLTPTYH